MSKKHKHDPNLLADWLNHQLVALEPYKAVIAVGAVIVLVAVLLAAFILTGDNPGLAQEWGVYLTSLTQDDPKKDLEKLTKAGTNNSPAVLYAKQTLADHLSAKGAELMFINRGEAEETLERAAKLYKEVESAAVSQPQLQSRARIGQAKVQSSLIKPDEARKLYEAVAKNEKDEVLKKSAEQGLKRLENERVTATLAWFATQKPRPPKTPAHGGLGPRFEDGVPDRPSGLTPGVKPIGTAPDLPDFTPPARPTTTDDSPKEPPADLPKDPPPADSADKAPEKSPEKTTDKPSDPPPSADK